VELPVDDNQINTLQRPRLTRAVEGLFSPRKAYSRKRWRIYQGRLTGSL